MAEWKTTYSGTPYCTNCNMSNFNTPDVCPHCNARMSNGFVRGHRAERGIIDWSDCNIVVSDEEIHEAIKPFIRSDDK